MDFAALPVPAKPLTKVQARGDFVFFVRAPYDDLQRVIGEGGPAAPSLRRRGAHPDVALFFAGQDDGHRLRSTIAFGDVVRNP
jgi:hypothetical protein